MRFNLNGFQGTLRMNKSAQPTRVINTSVLRGSSTPIAKKNPAPVCRPVKCQTELNLVVWKARSKAAAVKSAAERLNALTSTWSKKLAKAFNDAIKDLKNNIDVEALAGFIENNQLTKAYALVDDALANHGFKTVRAQFNSAVIAGANLGVNIARTMVFGDTPSSVQFSFDVTNPRAVDFLSNYGADKVAQLVDEQRTVLRGVLEDGVANGRNPLTIARTLKEEIGLTDYQAGIVSNFQDVIEGNGSVDDYLGYTLRDRRYDSRVIDALENDTPLASDDIENIVGRYAQRFIDYRADTIGRTEALRAVNAGNLEVWTQAQEDGKLPDGMEPRRFWVYTDDDKVREAHTEIPDMNPDGVAIDEPFETPEGDLMYPGDPDGEPSNTINCRCTVIYELRPKADAGENIADDVQEDADLAADPVDDTTEE